MKSNVSTLKDMLTESDYALWGSYELDYSILRLELEAYAKPDETRSNTSELIKTLNRTSIIQQVLVIELGLDRANSEEVVKNYTELTRLKNALLKLELFENYQRIYTMLVKSSRATDEDRWTYLELMKNLGQSTTSNDELLDNIHSDMIEMCNRLFDALLPQEGSEDKYTRLQAYYDVVGEKNGVTKCREALVSIETLRQKREKKRPSIGIGLECWVCTHQDLIFWWKTSIVFC